VRQVIAQLGYTSSMAARSLRSRTTHVVGLVVPGIWHPFTSLVIKGVNQVTLAHGYNLLVYASGRSHDSALSSWEQQLVAQLNGSVTNGIIVVTPNAANYRTACPVVAIDPIRPDTDFPAVLATKFPGGAGCDGLSGFAWALPDRLHHWASRLAECRGVG
jgi:LacI family transcriptional regulator